MNSPLKSAKIEESFAKKTSPKYNKKNFLIWRVQSFSMFEPKRVLLKSFLNLVFSLQIKTNHDARF